MRLWHMLRTRLASLFGRAQRETDLDEELRLHLALETERLQESGVPLDAARHRARQKFGGVDQIKEGCRDARGLAAIDALARDLRYAARRLAHDWTFTVGALLILSLGIGGNTAIFSLIDAALFRPPAFPHPDRLVDLYQRGINDGLDANSYPAYEDMAAYTDVFASVTTASMPRPVTYQDDGGLRSAVVEHTTASYLDVLGLTPSLGRWFTAAEDAAGADVVAVMSHDTWVRKHGADPNVLGRTLRMDGVPVTIVGVGPRGHNGTLNVGIVTDYWLPVSSMLRLGAPPRSLERRPGEAAFFVKARLRDGVSVGQARAAMQNLGTRLAAEYPRDDPGKGIAVYASTDIRVHPQMDAVLTPAASILLGVVGLVLVIACSNLATLLLVRATSRAKEVSVRLALGATRRQIVRHLLAESLLLAVAAGCAGSLLAWWAIHLLGLLDLPVTLDLRIDARVLIFALGVSLVTGLTFGLAPALKATKIDLVPTLREDGETRSSDRRKFTLKNVLVVVQVAVSFVLLGGTGIFMQMVGASRAQSPGFAVNGVAMIETEPRYSGYSSADTTRVMEDARRRIATIPGVQAAVLARGLPMQVVGGVKVVVDGTPGNVPVKAGFVWAGPGYFDALQIPILYGRAIDDRDRRAAPRVAVISAAMARQYFGDVNAVGRRFRFDVEPDGWFEVVGVARDTGTSDRQGDLVDPTPQLFYRAFAQSDGLPTVIVARTALDAGALAAAMPREMHAVDAALPVVSVKTMAAFLEESLRAPRMVALFLGVLGALGLALAGVGLYSVVAYAVSRRAREIGIRMALGARRPQVIWTVVRGMAALVAVGTLAGAGLSVPVMLLLRASTPPAPGITVYHPGVDPAAWLSIAGFMVVVGMAAATVPAWRATRLPPLIALRHD